MYRAIGVVAVALAAVGAVLPLMPSTIFLIIAAWAFMRGSPEMADWLRNHPAFGPYLRRWEERRAIPRSGKVAAVVGMTGAVATTWFMTLNLLLSAGLAMLLACVAAYIVTRPET